MIEFEVMLCVGLKIRPLGILNPMCLFGLYQKPHRHIENDRIWGYAMCLCSLKIRPLGGLKSMCLCG